MSKDNESTITLYRYKVRRQTKFLDDSTALKRATTYSLYEPLDIGGLYTLKIGKEEGFYRVESLIEVVTVW